MTIDNTDDDNQVWLVPWRESLAPAVADDELDWRGITDTNHQGRSDGVPVTADDYILPAVPGHFEWTAADEPNPPP